MWLTSRGTQARGDEMVETCPGMGLPEGHIEDVTLPTPLVIHTPGPRGVQTPLIGSGQKKENIDGHECDGLETVMVVRQ